MSVDDFKHRGRRKMLVDLLRSKGIEDENVLEAINLVPRHLFLDSAFVEFAYRDEAFPIAAGQTISHPFTVAFQTQLLDIQPNEKVTLSMFTLIFFFSIARQNTSRRCRINSNRLGG